MSKNENNLIIIKMAPERAIQLRVHVDGEDCIPLEVLEALDAADRDIKTGRLRRLTVNGKRVCFLQGGHAVLIYDDDEHRAHVQVAVAVGVSDWLGMTTDERDRIKKRQQLIINSGVAARR